MRPRRPGWWSGSNLALGLVMAASGLIAIGVLRDVPYAAAGALVMGVAGYAVLAVADVGRRRPPEQVLTTVGLVALGGGALSVLVLFASAAGPALPAWGVVGGLLAVLVAAVLALD